MECTVCFSSNEPHRRFCCQCGQALQRACPRCGFFNRVLDRFCGGCGDAMPPASVGARPEPQAVVVAGPRLVSVPPADGSAPVAWKAAATATTPPPAGSVAKKGVPLISEADLEELVRPEEKAAPKLPTKVSQSDIDKLFAS